jgi:hypothetical protein
MGWVNLTLRKEKHAIRTNMFRDPDRATGRGPQTSNDAQYGRLAAARWSRYEAALPPAQLQEEKERET